MAAPAAPVPNASCPRCGADFHCGVHDEAGCACTRLTLSAELLARLRCEQTGCLCLRCLHALAAQEPAAR
jgi:hypothetical protein